MSTETLILCGTAASIGLLHTLFGPDHYLPFIVMSRARRWTLTRTALITLACGVGHVLSSVVLGSLGVIFGIAVTSLEMFEGARGSVAAWLLIGFGGAYFVWGLHRAIRGRPHEHRHLHDTGTHTHEHTHVAQHSHAHMQEGRCLTPWILFTIFVFGPCEPLIPILMYPAAKSSIAGLIMVTAVFSVVTVGTMLSIVMLSAWGVSFAPFGKLERYIHAMAGATLCLSGLAIQFLGL